MNILIGTVGSRGDIQPLIALALALKAAGHNTLLCAPPENEHWIESYGCSFRAIGSDIMAFIGNQKNMSSIKVLKEVIPFMKNEVKLQTRKLIEIFRDFSADTIIASSLLFTASSIAEAYNVPYSYFTFCPQMFPSKHHPVMHIKNQNLPKWLNQLIWKMFFKFDMNFNYRKIVNEERIKLGVFPINDIYHHFLKNHVILASDRELCTVPQDVTQKYSQIGYLHLKQNGTLPPELEKFISTSKPVYVGFGSMPTQTLQEDIKMIVKAVRQAKKHAVLSLQGATNDINIYGDDIFIVNNVPHELLFPNVAAIIHHGGAGTTATAARFGVPQIIIPHILDQFYWANQIYIRKLGPKSIPRSKLTAKKLAYSINEALTNPIYKKNAQKVTETLNQQTPQIKAVKIIESL